MTVQIIVKVREAAEDSRMALGRTSSETMKTFYEDEIEFYESIADRLEALSVLYLSALEALQVERDIVSVKESQNTLLAELLGQDNEIVVAAQNWVDAIKSPPGNWADDEDWELIAAVQRSRGEPEDWGD